MSIYSDIFYSEGFYGSDVYGNPPGGPAGLVAYQNIIDNAVFYWALGPCSAFLDDFFWEVQYDTDPSYSSPAMRMFFVPPFPQNTGSYYVAIDSYLISGNTVSVKVDGFTCSSTYATSSDATMAVLAAAIATRPNVGSAQLVPGMNVILVVSSNPGVSLALSSPSVTGGLAQPAIFAGAEVDIINGRLHKGAALPLPDRAQGAETPLYWRVRGLHGGSWTQWGESVFNIPPAIDGVTRDSDLGLMPDVIYKKDAGSNIYGLHWSYGKSLDDQFVEDYFANNDLSTSKVRDASIDGKWSALVEMSRPQAMKVIDYREILKAFIIEARNSPTIRALRVVARSMLCFDPAIINVRDTMDFYVDDPDPANLVDPVWVEDTGVNPPTLWDDANLGKGTIVIVQNPMGAVVTRAYAAGLLSKLALADGPLYVYGIA